MPGIGWAAGVDRIANVIEDKWAEPPAVKVGVVYLDPEHALETLKLCSYLANESGIQLIFRLDGVKVKEQLKYIDK